MSRIQTLDCRRRAGADRYAADERKRKAVTVIVITQRPAVLNCMDKLSHPQSPGRVEAFGPPAEVLSRVVRGSSNAPAANPSATRAPRPNVIDSPTDVPTLASPTQSEALGEIADRLAI